MRCDVAVIGAGPAGLAAAIEAAARRQVVVLDLGPRAGGQYYRHTAAGPTDPHFVIRESVCRGRGVRILTGTQVFLVEPGPPFTIHTPGETITADAVVIATGAHDRVIPFPGWDLPGVMTAGGAQSLLKGDNVVPGNRIVVAGTGPFLLPVAAGFATAGARVSVFEANHPGAFARFPGVLARNPDKIPEAARYLATMIRHRVGIGFGHHVDAAHGTDELAAVTIGGRTIPCDILAVSHGFTPQIDIGVTLGCATRLASDGTVALVVDDNQATTVPGVYAAGEVTGVGGKDLAELEGIIAGLTLSGVDDPTRRAKLSVRRARRRAFAEVMPKVYPVPGLTVTDATTICRCEEVTHGTIAAAVTELGARDPRAVKLLTRAGMGWCQGRTCGEAVACTVAHLTGTSPDPAGAGRRILAQPVRLGDLATIDTTEER
jgi:NADPH-dependent 2,4-dienoyl-CoA reductase/sulfur reductase-like enzyme